MDSDDEDSRTPLSRYGMWESRKRLERDGFHPQVTSKTPKQIEKEVTQHLKKQVVRPSRRDFYDSQKSRLAPRKTRGGRGGGRGKGRRNARGKDLGVLTIGPWIHTKNFRNSAIKGKAQKPIGITAALRECYLGPMILEGIFRDGHRSAMNLSQTSSEMFKLVGFNVKRWDFTAMNYIVDAPSSVMIIMVPKYTVGDVREAHDRYPFPVLSKEWKDARRQLESQNHFDSYKLRSIEMEHLYFDWAQMLRADCQRKAGPFWVTDDRDIDPDTGERAIDWWYGDDQAINVMGSLKPLGNMWSANQFLGTDHKPHTMCLSLAMEGLIKLMCELYKARNHVRVLHLHDVPLLDRRMLAIILRGLPRVVMLGVYNCPLVHFGDVIPILDLIHEINTERREQHMPEIQAFDFYPHFNQGMPYEHPNAATYGISWAPMPMDIAQRGLYAILLKAFMKSKAMGIELLFSPKHAFMEYLTKIPNIPLGIYGFLDGIYRYLEVKQDDPNRNNFKLQAIYDILKPIRMALVDGLANDWPKYYTKQMAKTLLCCSSCGYQTFEEFFPANSKNRLPRHRRVCSGCLLQRCLDRETDHMKDHKKRLLKMLCPHWKEQAFNKDAPLFEDGAGLIRLESTETERPLPLLPAFFVDGLMRISPYYEPLMRDNKFQFDSLVGLPILRDVAEEQLTMALWHNAKLFAIKSDVFRRAVLELRNQYPNDNRKRGIPAFGSSRRDGGALDHQDEIQPPNGNTKKSFYDQEEALKTANRMMKKNW